MRPPVSEPPVSGAPILVSLRIAWALVGHIVRLCKSGTVTAAREARMAELDNATVSDRKAVSARTRSLFFTGVLRLSTDRDDVSGLVNGGALAPHAVDQHARDLVQPAGNVRVFHRDRLGCVIAFERDLAAAEERR